MNYIELQTNFSFKHYRQVLEQNIHKHPLNFTRDHAILTSLQPGIIPRDSSVSHLVYIL